MNFLNVCVADSTPEVESKKVKNRSVFKYKYFDTKAVKCLQIPVLIQSVCFKYATLIIRKEKKIQ